MSNLGKRKATPPQTTPKATATVTRAEVGEEGNDENVDPEQEQGGVVEEDDIVVISRELNETPKPSGKPAGKRARDKLEVQTRMLDLLE